MNCVGGLDGDSDERRRRRRRRGENENGCADDDARVSICTLESTRDGERVLEAEMREENRRRGEFEAFGAVARAEAVAGCRIDAGCGRRLVSAFSKCW